jgi:hypothetical protein
MKSLGNEHEEFNTPNAVKYKMTDDPTCKRYLDKDESARHILCDCEATAYLRFHHLSQLLMEPSDTYDGSTNKVLHFIQSVELTMG